MNEIESPNSEFNRRDFLKGGSFAAMMALMGGVPLIAQPAAETPGAPKPDIKKLKVAVIGLGAWGREILDQLALLPQAEIVAICDNYPAFLRRSSSKAPQAAAVEDYQAVLANKDVQAVVVATGTHQHKQIVVDALKAGKHVYCETPLAHTVEDAKAIALAAKNTPSKMFQAGLQLRSDPQRLFLLPFIRSGALGKAAMARAQWHKKSNWRASSPNAEREKALNWRLDRATSPGLVGELGIHPIDQAGWFLNLEPVAVSGFGTTMLWKDDGRDVADTIEAVVEYANGFRMSYTASLATSYDSEYELLHGSDAAVMMREKKAWMFKEVDAPLLGWEVYARKDVFYAETGIALVAGGSKQTALGSGGAAESAFPHPSTYYALEAFLGNCVETDEAVTDFKDSFPTADNQALAESLGTIKFRSAATYRDGYAATVLALKANEAINKGTRIELKKEMFEVA